MSSWAQRGAEQLLTPTPSPHPQAPTQPEAMHRRRRRRRHALPAAASFAAACSAVTAAAIATVLVTATAVCAAPESASPRRFCRSAAIAEAAVAAVLRPPNLPPMLPLPRPSPPLSPRPPPLLLRPSLGAASRLSRESGAPRGRRTKKKRRATVILGPTVDSERHLWCVGVAKVRLLHTL